jgi:hypothetical protein
LLHELKAGGSYVTLAKIKPSGSLQARRQRDGAVAFACIRPSPSSAMHERNSWVRSGRCGCRRESSEVKKTTDAKATYRHRRTGADSVPLPLREWFAGERAEPPKIETLAFPDYVLLPERWRAWKGEHPRARPPPGYEYLNDPPPRILDEHQQRVMTVARTLAARPMKPRRG